jgi:hypothetical protein
MTKRTLPLVLVLLLALVGCQGDDGGQAATATTTTVAPTTTTRPDPAEEGCRTFSDDPGRAHELLLISRDERIVEAAKLLEVGTTGADWGNGHSGSGNCSGLHGCRVSAVRGYGADGCIGHGAGLDRRRLVGSWPVSG